MFAAFAYYIKALITRAGIDSPTVDRALFPV